MSKPPADQPLVPDSLHAQTHWSRIQRLTPPPADDATARRGWEDAWGYLWEAFRPAMLAVVRRHVSRIGGGVVGPEEAEDIVQSFLVACLENDYFARADAGLGRFRTFVAVCLRRHATKYVEHMRRKRRSPSRPVRSLDDFAIAWAETTHCDTWEDLFEEEWARCILQTSLPRVGARSPPNELLLRVLCASPGIGIDDLALRLALPRHKIPLRLHRARKMLAEEVWEVVRQTVVDVRELEEERVRFSRLLQKYVEVADAPSLFERHAVAAPPPLTDTTQQGEP